MTIEYRYEPALQAVLSTVTGVVHEDEVHAHLLNLRYDDALPSAFIEIVDFSSTDDFAVRDIFTAGAAAVVEELGAVKGYRGTVFLAPNDLAYEVARMSQHWLESRGMRAEVYRDWEQVAVAVVKRVHEQRP